MKNYPLNSFLFFNFFTQSQLKNFTHITEKLVCIFIVTLTISPQVNTQPVTFNVSQLKKTASDAQPFDFFGSAVAYSGNTVMVGAIGRDNYRGAVYVFEFDGVDWIEKQILTDPNSTPGEFFGNQIDIDLNNAAIAGYGRDVVLIFNYVEGNWIYRQTIYNPSADNYFGTSVDIDDNRLIIGSEATTTGIGSANIYTYNQNTQQWVYLKSFFGSKKFGHSVTVSIFDSYLIGDYFSPPGVASGITALIKWNGTSWDSTLITPQDLATGDNFGYSISASDNKLFIGAPGTDASFADLGVVYFFTNDGINLTQHQKIFPDSLFGHLLRFGSAVSSGSKRLVVGCDIQNYDAPVYVFDSTASGYAFKHLILPEFASTNNRFGISIDVAPNNYFVVGASGENTQQGSAYFFTPYFLGNALNLDFYGGIFSSGTASIDTVYISISELPPGYENEYTYSWLLNAGSGLIFDGGYVGNVIPNISNRETTKLCWLKRNDAMSPWEYIGGQLDGNYLKSTIPFNSSCQLVVVDSTGSSGVSGIGNNLEDYTLYQNYPNPFNPSTKISWQSPISGHQTIKLFDVLGREVETIVDGYYEAGNHSTLYIPNSTLSSGVYFYQLKAGEFIQTKKMVLLR
uniref:T9SS type A sorting domain-containing protein n=1 Tax=Ignavibacterium album TaxID=591197 RepID=A0A832LN46_9BACT